MFGGSDGSSDLYCGDSGSRHVLKRSAACRPADQARLIQLQPCVSQNKGGGHRGRAVQTQRLWWMKIGESVRKLQLCCDCVDAIESDKQLGPTHPAWQTQPLPCVSRLPGLSSPESQMGVRWRPIEIAVHPNAGTLGRSLRSFVCPWSQSVDSSTFSPLSSLCNPSKPYPPVDLSRIRSSNGSQTT